MRRIITVSLLSLACVTGEAMAICTNNSMVNPVNTLNTLLSNKTVCGTDGTDKWQEEHRSNGALWEYAKGPNDPVDPSHQVGMWTLEENGQPGNGRPSVRYIYNGGSEYTFSVHDNGNGTYSFCKGNTEVTATIISSSSGCGP